MVNLAAAVNRVLVNTNRCSGLKVAKKKDYRGTANWPTCWLLLAVLLVLELSGASSSYPRRRVVVGILVLFIVVTCLVKRLGQSHDRHCDP